MADEKIDSVPMEDPEDRTSDASVKEDALVEEERPAKEETPIVEGTSVPIEDGDETSTETVIEVQQTIAAKDFESNEDVLAVNEPMATKSLDITVAGDEEEKMSVKEGPKSENIVYKDSKKENVFPLFDSKGSLLATESFTKERLQEFKEKRTAFALLIEDLQAKVKDFKNKSNPTDDDVTNLKKHHTLLLEKISEYAEMTREVERLMGMPQVPSSLNNIYDLQSKGPENTLSQKPSKEIVSIEEKLPKLIVCGTDMGDSIPRIIVCEPLNRAHTEPFYDHGQSDKPERSDSSHCEVFVKEKLKEAHEAQQKLAAENHELNEMRLKIQQELFAKQELLENMDQQMLAYESDNYRMQNENVELQRKLMCFGQGFGEDKIYKQDLHMKYKRQPPQCGAHFGTDNLDQDLEKMEGNGEQILSHRMCLKSENMPLNYPNSPRKPICKRELPQKSTQTDEDKEQDIYFLSDKDPKYKELKEQYKRLHYDFKNKVSEVASLRCDLEQTRTQLNDITILHHELEAKHQKELENNNALLSEKNKMQSSKDRILDLEQAAIYAKQMYTSSHEELEGMKALIVDLKAQLDEYRNKYMNTLQIAEELKKGNELIEIEYESKIAIEIQKNKLEMQEHLKELMPIKELLKVTEHKLKETEQMHKIALETIAQLSQKLETALKELEMAHSQIEKSGTSNELIENLQYSLEVAEKKLVDLENENNQLKETVSKLEQRQSEQSHLMEKKSHEVQVLSTQLETLREEAARQVTRLTERSDMIRKCLQTQIAEMEEEVAKCRAETSYANKERDKIRSKLQLEICMLSENFQESQNRILQLQQHINYLSSSHPRAFIDLCKESS